MQVLGLLPSTENKGKEKKEEKRKPLIVRDTSMKSCMRKYTRVTTTHAHTDNIYSTCKISFPLLTLSMILTANYFSP